MPRSWVSVSQQAAAPEQEAPPEVIRGARTSFGCGYEDV